MTPIALLVAALIASLSFAVPTPGNTYGYGGAAPPGYNAKVESFCTQGQVLQCCMDGFAGAAGLPEGTALNCTSAMAGGQVTYGFGFCPMDKEPLCCLVVGAAGVDTGCALPTQVPENSS